MNELIGVIKVIGDTTEYGAKKFRKREFVLTTGDKYPQDIKLELYQDDCSLIDEYVIGDPVGALYNIRGNEYNGKYYVNLQAWKIVNPENSPENGGHPEETAVVPTPKKRGRPRKTEPQVESATDLTENIEELADAPF